MFIIAGLGNPGVEYKNTRHNAGRIILEYFRKKNSFPEWEEKKKWNAFYSKGKVGKCEILLIEPNNFMNNSGDSLANVVTSNKKAEKLMVIYDDLDLPVGTLKISYNRGSGGHRGLESIIKSLKTKSFIRVRIGVAGTTPTGKIKKPKGDESVLNFLMGQWSSKEEEIMKKTSKKAAEALSMIILEGIDRTMGEFN